MNEFDVKSDGDVSVSDVFADTIDLGSVKRNSNQLEEKNEEFLSEPRFKYSRILNDVPVILGKESASCLAVHEKFLAIGTVSGFIYILDLLGNLHPENTVRHHASAVLKISIDDSGEYFVSCAQDARISIFGIGSNEYTQIIELKNSVRSVSIAPDFGKRNSGNSFVSAERNLHLHEKGFLNMYKMTTIFQGLTRDGFISQVSWNGHFIAFTNDTGTRIYDRLINRHIALVQSMDDNPRRAGIHVRPSHCWLDSSTLAVACLNYLTISTITVPNDQYPSTSDRHIEVCNIWKLNMFIADISYGIKTGLQNWNEIVLFGHMTNQEESEMQLLVLEPETKETFIINSDDRIKMIGGALHEFHMAALPNESLYFLLSQKEFIQAQPCSADDLVRWYLSNDLLGEALQCAIKLEAELKEIDPFEVGVKYVNSLISEKRFSEAAANLKVVCGRHKDRWEYYVNEFERNNVLLQIAKYLPVKEPQLEPECYQSVLSAALYNHPLLFYALIKTWNPEIYRIGAIIDLAIKRVMNEQQLKSLSEQDLITIYRSLAKLHLYERKFDKALALYINLRDKNVFQIIDKYNLFDQVKNNIPKLMTVDADLAVRLLIENAESLSAKTVLTQISKYPKLQVAYLNRLIDRNEGDEFADLAVQLYAEHDQKRLAVFLRKSESYDIAKAMEVCERKKYIDELVYLLGRSGDRLKALNLLVHKLDRIDSAIEFCRENDDADLWNALIDAATHKPRHITQLLNTAGKYADPLSIIEKIPSGMLIPGLRNSLVKILRDYESQFQMEKSCLSAMVTDADSLFTKLIIDCRKPMELDSMSVCFICKLNVLIDRKSEKTFVDVFIFSCGHSYHKSCLTRSDNEMDSRRKSFLLDERYCISCRNEESRNTKYKPD